MKSACWSTKWSSDIGPGLATLIADEHQVIRMTEIVQDGRNLRFIAGLEDYDYAIGDDPQDECCIMVRKDYGDIVAVEHPYVTNLTFRRGSGKRVRIQCLSVVVERRRWLRGGGTRELWTQVHNVSSAKDNLHPDNRDADDLPQSDSRRGDVHISVAVGVVAHVRQMRKAHGVRRTVVGGDWNIPLQKRFYRAYLATVFRVAGLRLNLGHDIEPTHGPARYDGSANGGGWFGRVLKVYPTFKGHDHRAISEAYSVTESGGLVR